MKYKNLTFDEERSLYALSNGIVENCHFDGPADGESALKEASNIKVRGCFFNLRYPLWHVDNAEIFNCELTQNCRAALWYDRNIIIDECRLNGIKALRECEDITLKNSTARSQEFIWKCRNISVENVTVEESEYSFFEVEKAGIDNLKLSG